MGRASSLCFLLLGLAGCSKCCETAAPTSPGPTEATSTSSAAQETPACPTCCRTMPTRTQVLAGAGATTSSSKEKQADAAPPVELKAVKLPQLLEAIAFHKGKIVVMDVWGDFCVPCKREFPHLVKLHKEHAKGGVVCMSLSVDEPESRAAALKFLQKQEATFANFWIDEPAMTWQNHFLLKGVPAVFVFGRDGAQAARFDNDDPDNQYTYADVENKVRALLQAK